MNLEEKKKKLDDAKAAFLEAEKEIEELRSAIATEICPIKIGDTVTVVDEGKEYTGVVDYIGAGLTYEEMLKPVVGAVTGWSVGGKRMKKTTKTLGTWSFGFSSLDAKLENGKWIVKRKTLEEQLGLT
jgi:hypothetical protein